MRKWLGGRERDRGRVLEGRQMSRGDGVCVRGEGRRAWAVRAGEEIHVLCIVECVILVYIECIGYHSKCMYFASAVLLLFTPLLSQLGGSFGV